MKVLLFAMHFKFNFTHEMFSESYGQGKQQIYINIEINAGSSHG